MTVRPGRPVVSTLSVLLLLDLPWPTSPRLIGVDDIEVQVQHEAKVVSRDLRSLAKVLMPSTPQQRGLPFQEHMEGNFTRFSGFFKVLKNASDCTPEDAGKFFMYLNEAFIQVLNFEVGMPLKFGKIPKECGGFVTYLQVGNVVKSKAAFETCVDTAMNLTVKCSHYLWRPVYQIWDWCKVGRRLPLCVKDCFTNSSLKCIDDKEACHSMEHCVKESFVNGNPLPDPLNQTSGPNISHPTGSWIPAWVKLPMPEAGSQPYKGAEGAKGAEGPAMELDRGVGVALPHP